MYFTTVVAVLVSGGLLGGCGDNSKECGQGTEDQDGTCVATCGNGTRLERGACVPDTEIICANGTILDPASGYCVIDPASCQGGTVLIGGECRDPTADDLVDRQEGAEPNGLGIGGEPSLDPAGVIALPATGAYVLHGTIIPADHDGDGFTDSDVDTYILAVSEPTLLALSADGVNGLAAGFVAVAPVDPADALARFVRYGLNVTGDTSRRQVFLPRAGTYHIAIGDTRAVLLGGGSPGAGAAAGAEPGKPDFEYYVSLERLAMPAPTPMLISGTVATTPPTDTLSGAVKFFSVAMGSGSNHVTLTIDTEQAVASFAVLATASGVTQFRALASGQRVGATVEPADTLVGGFATTDQGLIAVDPIMNYATEPLTYELVVTLGTAGAL